MGGFSGLSGNFPPGVRFSKACFIAVLVVLLLPFVTPAQVLMVRPPIQPGQPNVPEQPLLFGKEVIPRNMVWRPDTQRNQWVQAEVNSCEHCARPMTWKQAAFDKKALPLWLAAAGMAIADTEYTLSRPCIKAGTCTEWNPLLGTTRAQQYGVRMPVLGLAWLGASWARKGRAEYSIGGMRHWYLVPIVFVAMPSIGFVANSIR
jgi:hypothetical protein